MYEICNDVLALYRKYKVVTFLPKNQRLLCVCYILLPCIACHNVFWHICHVFFFLVEETFSSWWWRILWCLYHDLLLFTDCASGSSENHNIKRVESFGQRHTEAIWIKHYVKDLRKYYNSTNEHYEGFPRTKSYILQLYHKCTFDSNNWNIPLWKHLCSSCGRKIMHFH